MKLNAQLPKPDTQRNGLDQVYDLLVRQPGGLHLIVAVVDSSKTEIDHDRGNARLPHVRIRHVEVMTRQRDQRVAWDLLDGVYVKRTGASPMSFDESTVITHDTDVLHLIRDLHANRLLEPTRVPGGVVPSLFNENPFDQDPAQSDNGGE